jgi:hypothetical protein
VDLRDRGKDLAVRSEHEGSVQPTDMRIGTKTQLFDPTRNSHGTAVEAAGGKPSCTLPRRWFGVRIRARARQNDVMQFEASLTVGCCFLKDHR